MIDRPFNSIYDYRRETAYQDWAANRMYEIKSLSQIDNISWEESGRRLIQERGEFHDHYNSIIHP